jgi:AmmeMemoRadiSam system protein B
VPNPADDRPRLRDGLSVGRDDGGRLCLWDPHRVGGPPVPVTPALLDAASRFTGRLTLRDHQAALAPRFGLVPLDALIGFARALDASLFLDNDTLRQYLTGPTRRPSCVGCYPADPGGVRETVGSLFTAPGGPGLPDPHATPTKRLRAALLPHMDYARGNVTYGHGFKALVEQTRASLFVIVATSHYSAARFTLTRMNFVTPLGTVETDRRYVDSIARHYGDGHELFADPYAHLPEHSVELEVVVLHSLLGPVRPFRIVPLLCGSYHDAVSNNRLPKESPDVRRMIAALRAAEAECGEEVVYLISGDLAHIGPKFDDPVPVDGPWLARSRARDDGLCDRLVAADPAGYFAAVAAEKDERRICGLPPTYLTLETVRPASGTVLHYQQYVDPTGYESVSFASAAFFA